MKKSTLGYLDSVETVVHAPGCPLCGSQAELYINSLDDAACTSCPWQGTQDETTTLELVARKDAERHLHDTVPEAVGYAIGYTRRQGLHMMDNEQAHRVLDMFIRRVTQGVGHD